MKPIYILLFMPIVFTTLTAQISPPNFDLELKGDVKSFITLKYKAIDYFGKLQKIDSISQTYIIEMDDKNRIIKINENEYGKVSDYFGENEVTRERIFSYTINSNYQEILYNKRCRRF